MAGSAAGAAIDKSGRSMKHPNLLIVMVDQMRADALSCAGHPHVRTPHLDRLAAEGIRFSTAYTTNPLCMPARASFLTGTYSHNHGVWENEGRLPRRVPNVHRPLKQAGYEIAQVGKVHMYPHPGAKHLSSWRNRRYLKALGFDELHETTGPRAARSVGSILTDHWEERGLLELARADYARRDAAGILDSTWPSPLPEGETLDDFVGARAVRLLERRDARRPFLAFVGFGGPHFPWDPPASWAALYDPSRMDAPRPACSPGAHVPEPAASFQRHVQGKVAPTAEQIGRVRAMYYAKISHIDDLVGRLLETLERRALLERTAVLFLSDHGEMLGDRGRLGKAVCFEAAVRVPLLLRLPGAEAAGNEVRAPVSLIDAAPTLLELAGCPSPRESLPGRSLLALARDPSGAHHDAVFAELLGDDGFGAARGETGFRHLELVRDERWKLVRAASGEALMLFDLERDPEETQNLLGRAETEDTLTRLEARLDRWRRETGYVAGEAGALPS